MSLSVLLQRFHLYLIQMYCSTFTLMEIPVTLSVKITIIDIRGLLTPVLNCILLFVPMFVKGKAVCHIGNIDLPSNLIFGIVNGNILQNGMIIYVKLLIHVLRHTHFQVLYCLNGLAPESERALIIYNPICQNLTSNSEISETIHLINHVI